ncbi:MAG TPA: hypothetical protein VLL25_00435, partial [Acidimicrobiales bacterium]|nr:hypothetical protein [Acidimicrobiales bacterium]
ARAGWFADHGMPLPPALRQLAGPYYLSVDTAFRHSPALVSFRSWMHHAGESTYLQYALVHPWWVLSGTFGHHEELTPRVLSYYGGAPHHWLPTVARDVFLTYRQTTLLVATAVAAIVLFVRRRSLRREGSTLLWWTGLTAAGFLALILGWVGDSWEIGRHLVGPTVQVGIGLLFIISIALGSRESTSLSFDRTGHGTG